MAGWLVCILVAPTKEVIKEEMSTCVHVWPILEEIKVYLFLVIAVTCGQVVRGHSLIMSTTQGGEGVWQMLTITDEGGGGL